MKSDDPWFIARDGAQHGPLNDTEMQLFVERGHLRPTDLIWRQGFSDWRPAFSVFPPQKQTTQSPGAITPQPTPNPKAQPPKSEFSAPPTAGASPPYQAATPKHESPTLTVQAAHQPNPATKPSDSENHFQDPSIDIESKPGWGRAIAGTLGLGAIAGIGLWVFLNGPPAFLNKAGLHSKAVPIVKAPKKADAIKKQSAAKPTTPQRVNIDRRLQKAELWQFLKTQYPAWYSSVLKNVDGLDPKDNFERKLSELLISRLIELRRQNAKQVLAASSKNLTNVASTFLANLKYLAARGPEPCFSFISKGEASPAGVEVMRKPEVSEPIHKQLLATFKASVDGAKTPITRKTPQKSDYQALTSQLAKIGWNKEDIQLFANPQALSQAPPARVCQMVQDWFTAHLNLRNAETQERLLYETLRPVVSG